MFGKQHLIRMLYFPVAVPRVRWQGVHTQPQPQPARKIPKLVQIPAQIQKGGSTAYLPLARSGKRRVDCRDSPANALSVSYHLLTTRTASASVSVTCRAPSRSHSTQYQSSTGTWQVTTAVSKSKTQQYHPVLESEPTPCIMYCEYVMYCECTGVQQRARMS